MASSAGQGQPAAVTAGARGIAVGGDFVGIAVTGDNNNFELKLGGEEAGALLEHLSRRQLPRRRRRPRPLRDIPAEFPDHLDRSAEAAALAAASPGRPVNLQGEREVGKTYVLLRALNHEAGGVLADGAIYLFAKEMPLEDVLQDLFEAVYTYNAPCKPSRRQINRDLQDLRALVVVDSVGLEADDLQQLALALPQSALVLASRQRLLWSASPLLIEGLGAEDALALAEQELGRPLAPSERAPCQAICSALSGHPVRIRQALALAREKGRSIDELAQLLSGGGPARALAEAVDGARSPDEREVLQAVGVYGDAPVGQEQLAALLQTPGLAELLQALERRHELKANSPRYSRAGVLAEEREGPSTPSLAHARALRHFTSWAQERRGNFAELMQEAPALLRILRWAVDSERFGEAIALGRAIDEGFAWDRRWGAWGRVIETVYDAARRVEDRAAEAWALHQRGTRAVCLGETAAGIAALNQALEIREELGDTNGATASAHNLAVASRPPPLLWQITHLPFTILAVAGVLVLAAAGVTAAMLSSAPDEPGSPTQRPPGTIPTASTPKTNTGGTPPQATVTVAVTRAGEGSGQVTSDPPGIDCGQTCQATYPARGNITLSAQPGEGSAFARWAGACSSNERACTLPLKTDGQVTARFEPAARLTIRKKQNAGTVTSDPAGIACDPTCQADFAQGEPVTLSATPNTGATFTGWRGGGCEGTGACTVTLTSDQTIYALFRATPPPTTTTPTTPTTPPETSTSSG